MNVIGSIICTKELYHSLFIDSVHSKLVCKHKYQYQYIKILLVRPSVCVCVTDVGVAATNLRFVCKTITCVSAFTKNGHYLS